MSNEWNRLTKPGKGNTSLEMVNLNSSGETVPPSPVQMGTPSHVPQKSDLDESQAPDTSDKMKPSMEKLDELMNKSNKTGL